MVLNLPGKQIKNIFPTSRAAEDPKKEDKDELAFIVLLDNVKPWADPVYGYISGVGTSRIAVTFGLSSILSDVEQTMPREGVIKNFYIRVSGSTLDDSVTIDLLKNGVATGISLTFGAAENGTKRELQKTVDVSQEDLLALRFTFAGGTGEAGDLDIVNAGFLYK